MCTHMPRGTYVFMRSVDTSPLVRDGAILVDGIPGYLFVAYQAYYATI